MAMAGVQDKQTRIPTSNWLDADKCRTGDDFAHWQLDTSNSTLCLPGARLLQLPAQCRVQLWNADHLFCRHTYGELEVRVKLQLNVYVSREV